METTDSPGPSEAARLLSESQSVARGVAAHLRLPAGYSLMTGAGNAVLVSGIAAGNSDSRWGSLVFVITLIAAVGLQAVAMRRFRRLNGAWLNGMYRLRSGVLRGQAWVVLLACLAPLPATYANDRWWMRRYVAAFA